MKKIMLIVMIIALSMSIYVPIFRCSEIAAMAKINPNLLVKMNTTEQDKMIPVIIWLKDIDHQIVLKQALQNTDYDGNMLNTEKIISGETLRVFDSVLHGKSNEELNQYLELTKEMRRKELIETDNFLMEKRRLSRELYSSNNKKFVDDTNIQNTVFISQYSPMVIAEITSEKIKFISKNKHVLEISFYEKNKLKETMSTSIPTVNGNYNRDTIGLTGYGVKIGQFEPGVPDLGHEELNYDNIEMLTISKTLHAAIVANIMVGENGMAPDARLYSIGVNDIYGYDNRYENLELLLNEGVSVINMSATIEYERDAEGNIVDYNDCGLSKRQKALRQPILSAMQN